MCPGYGRAILVREGAKGNQKGCLPRPSPQVVN